MSSSAPLKPPRSAGGVQFGSGDPSLHELNSAGRNPSHQKLHLSSRSAFAHLSAVRPEVHRPMIGTSGPAASDSEVVGHAQSRSASVASTLAGAANSTTSNGTSLPNAPNPAANSAAPTTSSAPTAPNLAADPSALTTSSAPAGSSIISAPTASIVTSVPTAPIPTINSTTFPGTSAPIVLNPLMYPIVANLAQVIVIPLSSSGEGIPHFQVGNHHGSAPSRINRCSEIHSSIQACNVWRSWPSQQRPGLQLRRALMRHVKGLYAELFEIGRTRLPERRPDWALSTSDLHDIYPAFGFWKQVDADPKFSVPVDPEDWLFPYYRVQPHEIQGLATWSTLVMSDGGVGGIWSKVLDECPCNSNDSLGQWRQRLVQCLYSQVTKVTVERNLDLEIQHLLSTSGTTSLTTGSDETNEVEEYEDKEVYESEESSYEEGGCDGEDWEHQPGWQELEGHDESQPSASLSPRVSIDNEINRVEYAGGREESLAKRGEGQNNGSYEREERIGPETTSSKNNLEVQPGNEYQEALEALAVGLFRGDMNRAATYLENGGLKEQTHRFGSLKNRPSETPINIPKTKKSRSYSHTEDFKAGPSGLPPRKAKYHDKSTSPRTRESSEGSSSYTSPPSTICDPLGALHKRKRLPELEDPDQQRASKKAKSKVGAWAQSHPRARNFSSKSSNRAQAKPQIKTTSHHLASIVTPSGTSQARVPTSAYQAPTSTTPNSQPNDDAQTRPAAQNDDDEKFEGSVWCKKEGRALYNLVKTRREFEQVHDLDPLKDVKFWSLMSDRLARQNITRSGSACKNFWGRIGRGHFDYEERINPKNPGQKVTSAQLSKKEKQVKKTEEAKQKARQQGSPRLENEMQEQVLEGSEEDGEYEGQYEGSEQNEQYEGIGSMYPD